MACRIWRWGFGRLGGGAGRGVASKGRGQGNGLAGALGQGSSGALWARRNPRGRAQLLGGVAGAWPRKPSVRGRGGAGRPGGARGSVSAPVSAAAVLVRASRHGAAAEGGGGDR